MWIEDPAQEARMMHYIASNQQKFDTAKKAINENPWWIDNVIDITRKYPNLSKTIVGTLAMTLPVGGRAAAEKAIADIADAYSVKQLKGDDSNLPSGYDSPTTAQEDRDWQKARETHNNPDNIKYRRKTNPSGLFRGQLITGKNILGIKLPSQVSKYLSAPDDMRMGSWKGQDSGANAVANFLSFGLAPGGAKPFAVQYGVWGLLAWEGMGEAVRKTYRVWKYTQALNLYDKYLEEGFTREQAQQSINMHVMNADIPNIGTDKGLVGELDEWIKMWDTAWEMGGENQFYAAASAAFSGEAVNFDRNRKFLFESIAAEESPEYQRLRIMGYTEKEAADIFYKKMGKPIKFDAYTGTLNYTSVLNPNKILFYAGRDTNFRSDKVLELWETKANDQMYIHGQAIPGTSLFTDTLGFGKNMKKPQPRLLPYSAGRVAASEVFEPGTKRYNVLSGLIDGGVNLASELGVGAIKKFFTTPADMATKITKFTDEDVAGRIKWMNDYWGKGPQLFKSVNSYKKELAAEGTKLLAKGYARGDGALIQQGKAMKKEALVDASDIRTRLKVAQQLKREQFFMKGATRSSILKNDARSLIDSPWGRKIVDGIAEIPKDELLARLQGTPGLNILFEMEDGNKFSKMFIDASGNANKIRKILLEALELGVIDSLPGKQSAVINTILRGVAAKGKELTKSGKLGGRALSALGKEDAAYRSLGSYLGGGLRRGGMRLGSPIKGGAKVDNFDSLFGPAATFKSNWKNPPKNIQLIPELGMAIGDSNHAFVNLYNYLAATGRTAREINPWLERIVNTNVDDVEAMAKLSYELHLDDLKYVEAKGGDVEAIKFAGRKVFNDSDDVRQYFIDQTGKHMNFSTGVVEEIAEYGPDGLPIKIPVPTFHLLSETSQQFVPFVDYREINRALSPVFKHYGADDYEGLIKSTWNFHKDELKKFAKFWGDDSAYDAGFSFIKVPTKEVGTDAYTKLLDGYTQKVFKPAVLLRFAWFVRVGLEQQARLWVAGLDNMFSHPLDYIMWVKSHNQSEKLFGIKQVWGNGKDSSKLMESREAKQVLSGGYGAGGIMGDAGRRSVGQDYIKLKPGQEGYIPGVFLELSLLRNDEVAREVARLGYGDELIEWFAAKEQRALRQRIKNLGRANIGDIVDDVDVMKQYLQSVEGRIRIKTGDMTVTEGKHYIINEDGTTTWQLDNIAIGDKASNQLREAIASGELKVKRNGKEESIDFIRNLDKDLSKEQLKTIYKSLDDDFIKQGTEFGVIKANRTDAAYMGKTYDKAVNFLFEFLFTKPDNYLSRSAVFKQNRWLWIQNNFSNMSRKMQKHYIGEAKQSGVPQKYIANLVETHRNQKKYNNLLYDFDVVNNTAKAYGLAATKSILYDVSKKHLISDITRNVFPFPEVWFELATTWGKLIAENPYVVRQGQQRVRGANDASLDGPSGKGFFHPDPNGSGEEMFVYPGDYLLNSLLFGVETGLGVNVQPAGYVKGVNMLSQNMFPGTVPWIGFALDKVLPRWGIGNEVRNILYGDFGPPTATQAAVPLPSWLQKVVAAFSNPEGQNRFSQMRASSTNDIYRYIMATESDIQLYELGKLDQYFKDGGFMGLNDDDYINVNKEDATADQIAEAVLMYSKDKARNMFLIRALSQMVLPTGWTPRFEIEDNQGKWWAAQILADEYRNTLEEYNFDDDRAFEVFVNTYGIEHPWLTAPKTQAKGGKEPLTSKAIEFQEKNKQIMKDFKTTGYYLMPDNPNDEADFSARFAAYNKGDIEQLSPEQFKMQVNDSIGFFRYQNYSKRVDAIRGMSANEKDFHKRNYRYELQLELPGYNNEYGVLERPKTMTLIQEIENKWIGNKFVLTTEAGKGVNLFIKDWNEAKRASEKYSDSKNPYWFLSSADRKAIAIRIGLAQRAIEVGKMYPDFQYIWLGVFSRAFADDIEILNAVGARQ